MSNEKKPKVTEAVRELRLAQEESQEAFARRLNASVRTIARYETVRSPRGKPLAQLLRIAEQENLKGVAAVLDEALTRELYGDPQSPDDLPGKYSKVSPRTREFHFGRRDQSDENLVLQAVHRLLEDKRYKPLQKAVLAALSPIVEDMKRETNEFATQRLNEVKFPEEESR